MVVSRRRGPAASPAAQASRQPTRGAATAAMRKIEEGEAVAYEHSSDEDYDSLLESEGEKEFGFERLLCFTFTPKTTRKSPRPLLHGQLGAGFGV